MTLPAPLQFIVAMFAYALNARMARKMDYVQEGVLKEALAAATGKTRIELNAEQRRRLALKGKELTAEEPRANPAAARVTIRGVAPITAGSADANDSPPLVDRAPCGWSSHPMTDAELRDQMIVSAIQGAAVHEGAIPDDVARRAVDVADAVMTRLREKRTDPTQGAKPLG